MGEGGFSMFNKFWCLKQDLCPVTNIQRQHEVLTAILSVWDTREPYLNKTDFVIGNEDPQKLVALKSNKKKPCHYPLAQEMCVGTARGFAGPRQVTLLSKDMLFQRRLTERDYGQKMIS